MAAPQKKDELGQAEAQKSVDEASDKGFLGVEVDQTPNHHYSVAGMTSGKPTPETDDKQAAKAVEEG